MVAQEFGRAEIWLLMGFTPAFPERPYGSTAQHPSRECEILYSAGNIGELTALVACMRTLLNYLEKKRQLNSIISTCGEDMDLYCWNVKFQHYIDSKKQDIMLFEGWFRINNHFLRCVCSHYLPSWTLFTLWIQYWSQECWSILKQKRIDCLWVYQKVWSLWNIFVGEVVLEVL